MKGELEKKLEKLDKEISKEKGDFHLFTWVLSTDAEDMDIWDLIVSAPWIDKNPKDALNYLSNKLHSKFSASEIAFIAKIVVLGKDHPIVAKFLQKHKTKHKTIRVPIESNYGPLTVSQACISTSSTSIQTLKP